MEEIWEPIKGYEGLYEISNFGRVKSLPRFAHTYAGKRKRLTTTKILLSHVGTGRNEYLYVTLYKEGISKMYKIHRLVATAFVPNPHNKPQINHINGIKTDNDPSNLEWVTAKENVRHSFDKLGRMGVCKFTDEEILEIKNLIKEKPYKEITQIFDITRTYLNRIKEETTRRYLWPKLKNKLNKE